MGKGEWERKHWGDKVVETERMEPETFWSVTVTGVIQTNKHVLGNTQVSHLVTIHDVHYPTHIDALIAPSTLELATLTFRLLL
jgi:hypothetical protein